MLTYKRGDNPHRRELTDLETLIKMQSRELCVPFRVIGRSRAHIKIILKGLVAHRKFSHVVIYKTCSL